MTKVLGWLHSVTEWIGVGQNSIRKGATTYSVYRGDWASETNRLFFDLSAADAQTLWDGDRGGPSLA